MGYLFNIGLYRNQSKYETTQTKFLQYPKNHKLYRIQIIQYIY